jgi:tetratricopeptide (TPR) repeat protein
MKRVSVVVIALSASLTAAAPSRANSYQDGLRDYYAGRYQQAAIEFARASGYAPQNAMIHYYLANTLVHLNQHDAAIEEYKLCYALDCRGPVSEYCRQSLHKYHQSLPDKDHLEKLRNALANDTDVCQPDGTRASTAVGGAVEKSVAVIRRQVEIEKRKNEAVSKYLAEEAVQTGNQQAKAVQARAEIEVSKLYRPHSHSATIDPDAAIREQQIRNTARDEQDMILRRANERADRYRKVGQLKKTALDQVAQNLQSQLADNGKSSGVKLLPQGTDLYVRQYMSVPASRVLPEAHPAVVRIYAQHGASSCDSSESAEAASSAGNASFGPSAPASRSVKGKILQK